MRSIFLTLLLLVTLGPLHAAAPIWVYIGTYTRGSDSEGIYLSKLDLEKGVLSPPVLAGKADNPSFVSIAPDGRHLYAVEETDDFGGKHSGALRSFVIDQATGELKPINQVTTAGAAPCHLVTDQAGRHVFFANYTGGSSGAYAVDADGKLGARTAFFQYETAGGGAAKKVPHGHSINLDPAGRYAFVADLGWDRVMIYRYDAESGALTPNDPPFAAVKPGGGPRHFAFRPDAKFAYTNNESTLAVTGFAYDAAKGSLSEIQTISTLPADYEGKGGSTAEIAVHPSGNFLYVSNRGHDSIAIFAIDAATGKLTPVGHQKSGGKTPRNFCIDPTGRYLLAANQNSHNVVVFRIDPKTGKLAPTGSEVTVPRAVCVRFLQPSSGAFTKLFDGETTEGWEGKPEWFRVEDGCVVAGSLQKKIPNNEFLVTEREFGDFELRFEAKLVGQGDNAGVQIWSQRIPDHHEMIGFQCDIGSMGAASIWGALYDESRRGRFLAQVPLPTQRITTKKIGWNKFRVIARGDTITIWVNGGLAAQWFENEPADAIPRRGRIGLQVHSGPPLEAWYRNIEARDL